MAANKAPDAYKTPPSSRTPAVDAKTHGPAAWPPTRRRTPPRGGRMAGGRMAVLRCGAANSMPTPTH